MVIAVKKLMKRYGNYLVLDQLELEINKGEIFGILGPAGCGKTTLLQCVLGLISYDKGSVTVFGEKIVGMKNDMKQKIGVCFEENAVFETLTVYDNIYYFGKLYLKNKKRAVEATEQVIQMLGLHKVRNTLFFKLDEGRKKLCNFACAIVHNPELVFLDGGVAQCEPKVKAKIYEVLLELKKKGTTVLFLTSFIEEAEEICDRIAIMDKGRILAKGTKEELKRNISLGERSRFRVYHITEKQIEQIRMIPGVFYVEYVKEVLIVKSKRGRNNLLHILRYFQENEIGFGEIVSELPTLSDVFWEMTGKTFELEKKKESKLPPYIGK